MPFKKGHKINIGRKFTEETKEKIRQSNLGKKFTEEHKRKIGISLKGVYEHKPFSEEHKKKISESNKGNIPWNKGKKGFKHSEESKKNMSLACKGRKLSEETKKKISEANRGKKRSEEVKKRISEAFKGEKHPMFGKKQTKEARKKMSDGLKGENHPMYGIHGINHYNWKGDNAGKKAIHMWVVRIKGKAKEYKCEHCGKQAFDWSNKDHKYRRVLEDYQALCRSCHEQYDVKYNNKIKQ